jgi:hypothetical protein
MDFIIELSLLEEHNVILMIMNQLSKKRHYVSYIVVKEDITLEETTRMLYRNV